MGTGEKGKESKGGRGTAGEVTIIKAEKCPHIVLHDSEEKLAKKGKRGKTAGPPTKKETRKQQTYQGSQGAEKGKLGKTYYWIYSGGNRKAGRQMIHQDMENQICKLCVGPDFTRFLK